MGLAWVAGAHQSKRAREHVGTRSWLLLPRRSIFTPSRFRFTRLTLRDYEPVNDFRVMDPTYPMPMAQTAEPAPAKPKRRVNTSQKGAHVELLAIKLLEAEGYLVHRCIRTGSKRGPLWISQSNDVFGCIDLVAKKLGQRTRWIQVTADSGIGRKRTEMDQVPWDPQMDSVEIWRWVGGGTRKHKTTGAWLERQYFQVYHFDDHYELRPDRRIKVEPGNATLPSHPFESNGEVSV